MTQVHKTWDPLVRSPFCCTWPGATHRVVGGEARAERAKGDFQEYLLVSSQTAPARCLRGWVLWSSWGTIPVWYFNISACFPLIRDHFSITKFSAFFKVYLVHLTVSESLLSACNLTRSILVSFTLSNVGKGAVASRLCCEQRPLPVCYVCYRVRQPVCCFFLNYITEYKGWCGIGRFKRFQNDVTVYCAEWYTV